jgi:hypothetical protein
MRPTVSTFLGACHRWLYYGFDSAAELAPEESVMRERLIRNWVYGGFLAALILLALYPLLMSGRPESLRLTFLFLPIYMLHQYEEHDDDRFRLFFNKTIGAGLEVLTPAAVFVINILGVWLVIALACYLAAFVDPGFGLIAIYLAVVNALVHIIHAVVFRGYNPGLLTAVLLFLPIGFHAIARLDAGVGMNAIGVVVAIAIHAAIMIYAFRRRRALAAI